MVIIALDLGCDTGYCIGTDQGRLILSGHKTFKNDLKNPKVGYPGESRFTAFWEWLVDAIEQGIIDNSRPLLIVSEKTNKFMPGYDSVKLHFGFQACIAMVQTKYFSTIESKVVPALTIKKYWLGSAKLRGKESKAAMVKKAQERYPDVIDHNEADAIALFHHTQENLHA